MSSVGCVIIRLQNLPLEARSIDVRRFFDGLQIPDGGVHIIGGERGDAFIAFNSDDDARMAMARDGLTLCSSRVRLYLSSKNEMNAVIAAARGGQPIPSASVAPPPSSLQSNVSVASTAPQQNTNILDSITKLIAGNKLPQVAGSGGAQTHTPQLVATDPLKTLTSLLPPLKPASNSTAATSQSVFGTTNSNINSAYHQTASASNTMAAAASGGGVGKPPNINIDQILDLLKNHLNKPPTGVTQQLANQQQQSVNNPAYYSSMIQPTAYTAYNSSSNNNNNNSAAYSYYNAAANSSTYPPITSTHNTTASNGGGQPKKKTLLATPPDPNQQQYSAESNGSSKNTSNGSKKTLIQTKPPTSSYTTSSSRSSRDDFYYDNGDKPASADWSSIQLKSSDKIIKLKNFKTTSSYRDIRNFLQGISIEQDGIKLLQDYQTGAKNGQALVRLVSTADMKKALSRNGQFHDDQCIQVFESSVADFNRVSSLLINAEAKFKANSGGGNNSSSNKRVLLPTPPNGNGHSGGGGSPTSDGHSESRYSNHHHHHHVVPDGFYLKVYGLPPEMNDDEVRDLFGDVHIMRMFTAHTPFGGGGGGIVKAKKLLQVETKQDVDRALKRNDERFGKSKLHIYQINKYDFEKELNREEFREMKRKRQQQLKDQLSIAGDQVGRAISDSFARGGGRGGVNDDNNDQDEFKNRKRLRLEDEEDQYSRNSDNNSRTRDSSEEKDDSSRSNGRKKKSLLPLPPASNDGDDHKLVDVAQLPSPQSQTTQPLVIDLPPLPPELQQYSSQMVLLSNVNHEATREDILELFRDYEPIDETLKIRHDDQGLPTGDAIVAASSQLKAIESVQQLNGSRFMGQRIRVLLINPV